MSREREKERERERERERKENVSLWVPYRLSEFAFFYFGSTFFYPNDLSLLHIALRCIQYIYIRNFNHLNPLSPFLSFSHFFTIFLFCSIANRSSLVSIVIWITFVIERMQSNYSLLKKIRQIKESFSGLEVLIVFLLWKKARKLSLLWKMEI